MNDVKETANIHGIILDVYLQVIYPFPQFKSFMLQVAVWMPFFRGHSSGARREPYLFSKTVQKVIRDAISQRYEYLGYIYNLFYEHTLTGEPIIRPLFYDFPGTHKWDSQFLIGKTFCVFVCLFRDMKKIEYVG